MKIYKKFIELLITCILRVSSLTIIKQSYLIKLYLIVSDIPLSYIHMYVFFYVRAYVRENVDSFSYVT